MARILVTGSADGLGRATAQTLLEAGHHVGSIPGTGDGSPPCASCWTEVPMVLSVIWRICGRYVISPSR
ncbi:hypothetical protein [Pseudonocardia sp. DSM 110487]|uniref:hypothetical protein n=1 Tax=Pseudonocardia sp. DSM 110487 TaxID=2865833 RepID=UPI00210453A3|nr:hypothetical protein [Pseudonocardia sp. DSM 110487]